MLLADNLVDSCSEQVNETSRRDIGDFKMRTTLELCFRPFSQFNLRGVMP